MVPSPGHTSRPAVPPGPPVFVLGAARTGTTLLQRILNSYDDILVWGEHAGVLRDLAAAYFRGAESPYLFSHALPLAEVLAGSEPENRWQAWMTWLGREQWPAVFREIVEALLVPRGLPGKQHWGFKETRYLGDGIEDRTVEFLHAPYPEALFAFVVRHPLNALASARRMTFGRRRGLLALQRAADRWLARYRAYEAWHRSGRLRSFWIVYEELKEGRGAILDLLAAIGKSLGPRQQAVMNAAAGRGSAFRDARVNERWKQLPWHWLMVIDAILGPHMSALGYTRPRLAPGVRLVGRVLVPALRTWNRWRASGAARGRGHTPARAIPRQARPV